MIRIKKKHEGCCITVLVSFACAARTRLRIPLSPVNKKTPEGVFFGWAGVRLDEGTTGCPVCCGVIGVMGFICALPKNVTL